MDNEKLLKRAFQDFKDDFEELEYLVTSNLVQLEKFRKRIETIKSVLRPEGYDYISKLSHEFTKNLKTLQKRIQGNLENTNKTSTMRLYEKLLSEKDSLYDILRIQQGILASLIVSADFQSPSFLHARYSQAGSQTGKITGNINDYKRDVHLDGREFETLYKKEYIDARFKFSIYPYLTNSGMSAFTTIFTFLLGEKKITGPILFGKSSYFQYKLLLKNTSIIRSIEVDENRAEEIIDTIKKNKPSAIFLDTLTNSPQINVCEIQKIISYLIKNSKQDVYLVLDTTCTCLVNQYWNSVFGKNRFVHLITFESLNKYHQFGMDRVTAGIINVMGRDLGTMYFYREDCGTIISDASVYALPIPNKKIFTNRWNRLNRNAQILSQVIKYSSYPGIGSFFTLQFQKKYQTVGFYKAFVKKIIQEAKKQKVNIIAGTSFGLNITRVYHIIPHDKNMTPFMRISAGTEDVFSIEKIKKVFETVINKI